MANCPEGTELVLIHDAVRPFVTGGIIKSVLEKAMKTGAAGPAVDMDDTVILEKDGQLEGILERKNLKRMQTPQGFSYEVIRNAHESALKNKISGISDDCGLVMEMGTPVSIVKGSVLNMKITNKSDFFLTLYGLCPKGNSVCYLYYIYLSRCKRPHHYESEAL